MNLFLKTIAISVLTGTAFFVLCGFAFASVSPVFPTCLAPQGNVIANYPDGTHGIVGLGSKDGQDTVYSVENGALQCLCATDGTGTETDWMSSSNLSQDDIKVYQNEGWIYVPDGTAWGLSDGSYLAKNISYSCSGTPNTSVGGGQGQEPNNPSDGKSDGRSDGASIVQAATGNSLASTGNILLVLSILGAGVVLSIVGIVLRKKSN